MFVSESWVENRPRKSAYDKIYFSSGLHGLLNKKAVGANNVSCLKYLPPHAPASIPFLSLNHLESLSDDVVMISSGKNDFLLCTVFL